MANTPPPPPINERDSVALLKDLCVELRQVACSDSSLPDGEYVVERIKTVAQIHAELQRRAVDPKPKLELVSAETNWRIVELLNDCLSFPKTIPYVREADGLRRALRCQLCAKAERSPDSKLFWFCDDCMRRLLESIRTKTPIPGITLCRTYNSECRCEHADDETVLACGSYLDQLWGNCERCVRDEIERRKTSSRV